MLQHVRVAKRAQHAAPNSVAICCVEMLRSFVSHDIYQFHIIQGSLRCKRSRAKSFSAFWPRVN